MDIAAELVIRKAERADAQKILDYLNVIGGESDNLLFGAGGFSHMSAGEEADFIESANASAASVLLVGTAGGEVACVGSISASDRERVSHNGELAVSVLKKFWGMGVGTAMVNALIDFAKAAEKLEVLHLGVKEDNLRAIALYRKLGFQETGRHRGFFKIGGKYFDEILMSLELRRPQAG